MAINKIKIGNTTHDIGVSVKNIAGILSVNHGGTGNDLNKYPDGVILCKQTDSNGNAFVDYYSKPLSVAAGGTNATTASDARTNLGALAKEGDIATGFMQLSGGFGTGTGTGMGMLITPKDGYLRTTHENNTGILKIVLPNDFNGAMIKFDVDIWSYNKQAICTYSFGGQIYKNSSTGANQWAYRSYSIKGNSANNDFMNLPINFGRHNEKAAVSIGIDTTEWRYCMFSVKNIEIMYNYYGVNNWDDGWSIIVDTNPLDEIFNTHDNPLNRNRQNLGFTYGTTVPTEVPATGEGSVCFVIDDGTPLPIEEGGTGAVTVEGIYANLGTADYIVEQGKGGNWYYRKWNSGVVELWGSFTQTSTAYAKNSFVVGSASLTGYPFTITEPIAQATGRRISTGIGLINYDYERTDYWSGIMIAPEASYASGVTESMSYYVHVFAKWK